MMAKDESRADQREERIMDAIRAKWKQIASLRQCSVCSKLLANDEGYILTIRDLSLVSACEKCGKDVLNVVERNERAYAWKRVQRYGPIGQKTRELRVITIAQSLGLKVFCQQGEILGINHGRTEGWSVDDDSAYSGRAASRWSTYLVRTEAGEEIWVSDPLWVRVEEDN